MSQEIRECFPTGRVNTTEIQLLVDGRHTALDIKIMLDAQSETMTDLQSVINHLEILKAAGLVEFRWVSDPKGEDDGGGGPVSPPPSCFRAPVHLGGPWGGKARRLAVGSRASGPWCHNQASRFWNEPRPPWDHSA